MRHQLGVAAAVPRLRLAEALIKILVSKIWEQFHAPTQERPTLVIAHRAAGVDAFFLMVCLKRRSECASSFPRSSGAGLGIERRGGRRSAIRKSFRGGVTRRAELHFLEYLPAHRAV